MESIALLKKLAQIDSAVLCNQDRPYRDLMDDLMNSIRMEIQCGKLPKVSVNIAKAAKKFSEYCYAQEHDKRESIAGANFYHDKDDADAEVKRQWICDGFLGVSYSIPFDGVIHATGEPMDANQVLDYSWKEPVEITLPSLAELKKAVKVESAERRKKLQRSVLRMPNGKLFNIHHMIRIMELCGMAGGETAIDCAKMIHPLYINTETEDGNKIKGVLLPVSPIRFNPEQILLDYTKE